jgi:hypothetical protein
MSSGNVRFVPKFQMLNIIIQAKNIYIYIYINVTDIQSVILWFLLVKEKLHKVLCMDENTHKSVSISTNSTYKKTSAHKGN